MPSVGEIIGAAHPPSGEKKVTIVLKAYFDDSGVDANSRILALCGFVADCDAWKVFDSDWKSRLIVPSHEPLEEFHMYECVHALGPYKSWGTMEQSFADRLMLSGQLISILERSSIHAIGSAVVNQHFSEWASTNVWLEQRLGEPYNLCFEFCIQQAVHLAREHTGEEKVALIFDINATFAEKAWEAWKRYKKDPQWNDILVSLAFADSKEFTPLQAADVFAYGTGYYNCQRYYPGERKVDFPVLPLFTRLIRGVEASGGIYDFRALEILIRQIIDRELKSQR